MTKEKAPEIAATEEPRGRKPRKKVYQRAQETLTPDWLDAHFAKDDYELKWVRWAVQGNEDFKNLNYRLNEGFEFVTKDELPERFKGSYQIADSKSHPGLITVGDLCLMKIDKDLRKSMREYYDAVTAREVDAVSLRVLEKKGFRNLGSKNQTVHKEPKFQD